MVKGKSVEHTTKHTYTLPYITIHWYTYRTQLYTTMDITTVTYTYTLHAYLYTAKHNYTLPYIQSLPQMIIKCHIHTSIYTLPHIPMHCHIIYMQSSDIVNVRMRELRHWPSIAGMSPQSHCGDEDGPIGLSSWHHYIHIWYIYIYIYIYMKIHTSIAIPIYRY